MYYSLKGLFSSIVTGPGDFLIFMVHECNETYIIKKRHVITWRLSIKSEYFCTLSVFSVSREESLVNLNNLTKIFLG